MNLLKCPKCHAGINQSDKFCPHCGFNLEEISSKQSSAICSKCNHPNLQGTSFCQKCGAPLLPGDSQKKQSKKEPHKIVSKGNYSGTMIKGKTSRGWKIFRNIIIALIFLGIVALIIWFQVDPEAGAKLTNIAFGLGVMLIFVFFIYRASKKGKYKRKRDFDSSDDDWHDDDDNDDDDDDDD